VSTNVAFPVWLFIRTSLAAEYVYCCMFWAEEVIGTGFHYANHHAKIL